MDLTMKKALSVLAISAMVLLALGSLLYYRGSQLNLQVKNVDESLWQQSPGDIWLYVGGLMMLIAGSLTLAAARIWLGRRRDGAPSSWSHLEER